jgi:hypothetical protein
MYFMSYCVVSDLRRRLTELITYVLRIGDRNGSHLCGLFVGRD